MDIGSGWDGMWGELYFAYLYMVRVMMYLLRFGPRRPDNGDKEVILPSILDIFEDPEM